MSLKVASERSEVECRLEGASASSEVPQLSKDCRETTEGNLGWLPQCQHLRNPMDHLQPQGPGICLCYALLCCVASWALLTLSDPSVLRS